MFQNFSIIRPDGTEITIKDNFDGSINNDNDENFIIDNKSPVISIIDNKGKIYNIATDINGGEYTLLDLRRQEKAIAEFFAELSEENFQKLIENNINNITFDSEPDEEFSNLYELDKNGECIYIYEDLVDGFRSADIISPKFAPPEVEETKIPTERQIKTNDGHEISIKNDSPKSSIMTIKSSTGKTHSITLLSENSDEDLYQKGLLPRFSNIVKVLPKSVIEDLINEVDKISLMKNSMLGYYKTDSNILSITLYDTHRLAGPLHPKITLIHELGHAIDNIEGGYMSDNPEFTKKFDEFAKLAEKFEEKYFTKTNTNKYRTYEKSHALENPQEFFASVYADIGVNNESIEGNYIAELDKIILAFKNSENQKEQRCYKLYLELKNEAKNMITEIRTKSNRK